MTAEQDPEAGAWRGRLIVALLCILVGGGAATAAWLEYQAGLVSIYQPPGGVSRVGGIQAWVPSEAFTVETDLRIVESGVAAAPFVFTVTLSAPGMLQAPPRIAVRFMAPLQVTISSPVASSGSRRPAVDWFDLRSVPGKGQLLVVGEPGRTMPVTAGLPDVGQVSREYAAKPWFTFDGKRLVVRIAGWFVNGVARSEQKARTTYGLPAELPAGVNAALAEPGTVAALAARWPATVDESATTVLPTGSSLEMLYRVPDDGTSGLSNRIPADARVDYVAPSTTDPDILKWSAAPSTEGLLVRLSYVSRSAEQSGQSRVFLAGAGLGFALSVFLLAFEIGPWRPMYEHWLSAYREAHAKASRR
ncbi:hypothetical protein Q0Z83_023350 [Actinoplanes sichuanensis]|uniref:DUF2330 domain-containing protein n=1 Tax=Actinoplanes sichuanensis TaxID=512349 RepID=A0ABW4A171_9ACTN|nr:hypothetical protein [Actinoplanes sichuanensis]BEL04144.1 hypothetical protein Q0Z83_023350 [Actinoplanes sichuanensis]